MSYVIMHQVLHVFRIPSFHPQYNEQVYNLVEIAKQIYIRQYLQELISASWLSY